MTRDQLKERLRARFENNVYYTDADFNAAIQDGYDEVAAFSGCILKTASLEFVGGQTYYDMITLLPDYLGAVALFNQVTKRWIIPSSLRKFDEDRYDWETAVGTPWYFTVLSHRYLAFYKKYVGEDPGSFLMFYKASAPTIEADDDFLIADQYIKAPEDYIITDLWEQNQEWTKAGVHLKDYQTTLLQLVTYVHSRRLPDRAPQLRDSL